MLDEELPDANKASGILQLFILFILFFYFTILVPQQKVEVKESAKNKDLDDLESFLN